MWQVFTRILPTGQEDPDPYQQAERLAAAGEISDFEIKSMFSLMSTSTVS